MLHQSRTLTVKDTRTLTVKDARTLTVKERGGRTKASPSSMAGSTTCSVPPTPKGSLLQLVAAKNSPGTAEQLGD